MQLTADLKENGFDAYVESIERSGDKLYRVRVGKFESKDRVIELQEKLLDAGYPTKIFP
ncbi:MAG TPA: SPOR domain-containing protein [Candidatus Omnitrophica bacterium]|nr:SPOR domain-containing protein [Candidatus Omnitrophota bacterium]